MMMMMMMMTCQGGETARRTNHSGRGPVWAGQDRSTHVGLHGVHMWAFMEFGVVPDIVTVGKGLGNGYPMGAVICSKEISDKLGGGYFSTFGGNPVSCSIGENTEHSLLLLSIINVTFSCRTLCVGHCQEREASEFSQDGRETFKEFPQ